MEINGKIEMEHYYIDDERTIESGETLTISYKVVHFKKNIICSGRLEFDHCIIYYNEFLLGEGIISLGEGARLKIENSRIICNGYDKTPFIKAGAESSVSISCTDFEDCSYFLEVSFGKKIKIDKCKLNNCFRGFVSGKVSSLNTQGTSRPFEFSNNQIISEKLTGFNRNGEKENSVPMIRIDCRTDNGCWIYNNIVTEKAEFDPGFEKSNSSFTYFDCAGGEVKNCTFKGVGKCVEAVALVSDCVFENCREVIKFYSMSGLLFGGIMTSFLGKSQKASKSLVKITDCRFKGCTDVIYVNGEFEISDCQFISCGGKLIEAQSSVFNNNYTSKTSKIAYCEFVNKKAQQDNTVDCIASNCSNVGSHHNIEIEKCSFSGFRLNNNYLITATGYNSSELALVKIMYCTFEKCSTKREDGYIINPAACGIDIESSAELEKLKNKRSSEQVCEVIIKNKNSYGNPIGAIIEDGADAHVDAFRDVVIKKAEKNNTSKSKASKPELLKNALISENFFGAGVDVDISRIFPVVVMATMSSGKSTLVNALLGEEILPNRNEACTAKIFSVLDDDTATENKLYVTRKSGDVDVITEELVKELELANNDDSVSEILLSGQIKGVQNTERSMLLVDTPGPNNSIDLSHAQITEQILNKINGGMILYVMNATQMGINDDCELLHMVSDKLKNKKNLKVVFVMNKMDELDVEKESVFDFIKETEEYLGKNGFENPEIIPVSALAAVLFKKAVKGKKLTRKQQNDFEIMYEIFKSEGMRLGAYVAKAELQKEVEVCGMKYTLGQLERAIENTGLTDLEHKIQEHQILSSGMKALKVNVREQE